MRIVKFNLKLKLKSELGKWSELVISFYRAANESPISDILDWFSRLRPEGTCIRRPPMTTSQPQPPSGAFAYVSTILASSLNNKPLVPHWRQKENL